MGSSPVDGKPKISQQIQNGWTESYEYLWLGKEWPSVKVRRYCLRIKPTEPANRIKHTHTNANEYILYSHMRIEIEVILSVASILTVKRSIHKAIPMKSYHHFAAICFHPVHRLHCKFVYIFHRLTYCSNFHRDIFHHTTNQSISFLFNWYGFFFLPRSSE